MSSKEFFKPTLGKLIVPILFLIYIIYGDLFSPILGSDSISERFVSAITNYSHMIFVLGILILLYILSCSFFWFVKKR